jgi:hypothetical protein
LRKRAHSRAGCVGWYQRAIVVHLPIDEIIVTLRNDKFEVKVIVHNSFNDLKVGFVIVIYRID